jgi:hypothetical protein
VDKICNQSDAVLQDLLAQAGAAGRQTAEPGAAQGTGICPVDLARQIAERTVEAGCGKGVMCRDGMRQILLILRDIANGAGSSDDLPMLEELLQVIGTCADCVLSENAAREILALLKKHPEDWRMHVTRKKCNYRVCQGCIKETPAVAVPEGGVRRRRRRTNA